MENNNMQTFCSKRPVCNRYELKINRENCIIHITVKGKEITEYDIPFSTIAEAELSTYGFLTEEQIREKQRAEYSEAIQSLAGNNKQKVTTNKGSMLGRAIVGGLIAGPVGAIVGGATASKTIEDTSYASGNKKVFPEHTGYALSIRLNDIDVPYIKYDCGEDSEGANTIYSILKILIRENASKGFSDSKKVEVKKTQKPETVIHRKNNLSEKETNKKDTKRKISGESVKPVSNKLMVMYAICQAIFTGLLLTVWNAGWWPAIIMILSLFIQVYPLMEIFEYDEKGYSYFSKGIIVASLIILIGEALLPYFATSCLNLYLGALDMNLYIRSYEGGAITFLMSPVLASLLAYGFGYFIKSIQSKNVKLFGKCSLPALIASTINFIFICSASIVIKAYNQESLLFTVIGSIYGIISSILIYVGVDASSFKKKEKNDYGKFVLGILFQFCLLAIVVAICAGLGIIVGYSYPISIDEVW